MRRPLFTSGIPQIPPAMASIVATPNSALSIYDLRSLSEELQSYTRFVTLYGMNRGGGDQIISVAWRESTDTPILLFQYLLPQGVLSGAPGVPVKVLDRFPLRGDAELLVSNATGDSAAVWGYFELDATVDVTVTTRPLEPAPLVAPFTYAPVAVETDSTEQVHLFVEDYYDLVTLDVVANNVEGTTGIITISDGDDTVSLNITSLNTRLFDAIPMMAIASTTVAGITATTSADENDIRAWGSFNRVS